MVSRDQFKVLFRMKTPISQVFENTKLPTWEIFLSSKEHEIFFRKAFSLSIEALECKNYHLFDAHTTTNCCHGMGILVYSLVEQLADQDLNCIESKIEDLPGALVHLVGLYLLCFIKKSDKTRGARTEPNRLAEIHPISRSYFVRLIHHLQKFYSNLVADSYSQLNRQSPHFIINGIPLSQWEKYLEVRSDRYGAKYVSNLYSMQTALAFLMRTEKKVALVDDLRTKEGSLMDRLVLLFQGNGKNFTSLSQDLQNDEDPVVVFCGFTYQEGLCREKQLARLLPWLEKFESLILACDVFYPQFPKVRNDPDFNSSPILPEEENLVEVLKAHSTISGVTVEDPSFFCLSHIYTASVKGLLNGPLQQNPPDLPQVLFPGFFGTYR